MKPMPDHERISALRNKRLCGFSHRWRGGKGKEEYTYLISLYFLSSVRLARGLRKTARLDQAKQKPTGGSDGCPF
jgi:hypothetical protein